jgi:hypothetical protein
MTLLAAFLVWSILALVGCLFVRGASRKRQPRFPDDAIDMVLEESRPARHSVSVHEGLPTLTLVSHN